VERGGFASREPRRRELKAVAASSPTDAWAVGYGSGEPFDPVIEHWDGVRWTVVPTPHVGPNDVALADVWASSPHDAWAVGQAWDHALALRWDGKKWTVAPTPDVRFLRLNAVAGTGPDDLWAVGTTYSDVDGRGPSHGLAEHWDGARWNAVLIAPVSGEFGLTSVVAVGANDVWALGTGGGGFDQPLLLHRDGSAWRLVPGPSLGAGPVAGDLAAASGELWFAGTSFDRDRGRTVSARRC
jgi:hypothetical protein